MAQAGSYAIGVQSGAEQLPGAVVEPLQMQVQAADGLVACLHGREMRVVGPREQLQLVAVRFYAVDFHPVDDDPSPTGTGAQR